MTTGMPTMYLVPQAVQQQAMRNQMVPVIIPSLQAYSRGDPILEYTAWEIGEQEQLQQQPVPVQQQMVDTTRTMTSQSSSSEPKAMIFESKHRVLPRDQSHDLSKDHEIRMDDEARVKHEQKWAAWAIKTLSFLKNLLSWEDKVSLNRANLEEMNLSLLIGLLRDLNYYSAANSILTSYYDSRLLDPPREVTSQDINSAQVELITDSACSFVDYNAAQNVWDKYPKMNFGEDVPAALVGHPTVKHYEHRGGVFKGLNETTKGLVHSKPAQGSLRVGVFISMGNDCYTKKRNAPKKLRQTLDSATLQQLSEQVHIHYS
jgi:hypothetical protein